MQRPSYRVSKRHLMSDNEFNENPVSLRDATGFANNLFDFVLFVGNVLNMAKKQVF